MNGTAARAALLLVLALAVVACGDGDGGGQASGDKRPTEAVGGSTAAFTEGVAAGDVTDDSAVLWTRAEGGDTVTLEYGESPAFDGAERTAVETSAARDYTVKVAVTSLKPRTRYYYRFRAGDAVSTPGTFVTAPTAAMPATPLRFVFAGDSDGSRTPDGTPPYNSFEVLAAAQAEAPAFFLYFGDTIYADRTPLASTLDGYRGKYRENRGYGALASLLANTATYVMWDDHEVVNDFAGTTVERGMFDAGRQAFREYMPIGDGGDAARMYRAFRWGRDLELIVLDARSFRDASAASACAFEGNPDPLPAAVREGAPEAVRGIRGFVGLPPEPPAGCLQAIDNVGRTLLGAPQKQFLKDRLRGSDATWKIIVNPVPMQSLLALPYDRWEGYAAERTEILDFIRDEKIKNVVFLATDFHASIFGPVRIDPFVDTEAVAYEAVVGPIATTPLERDVIDVIGETAAGLLDTFFLGVAKVDCAQLDSYAYGVVELDPADGTLTIRSKDASGRELCTKELTAE